MSFTAVFQKVKEGYIGFVEELPGANSELTLYSPKKKSILSAGDIRIRTVPRLFMRGTMSNLETVQLSYRRRFCRTIECRD